MLAKLLIQHSMKFNIKKKFKICYLQKMQYNYLICSFCLFIGCIITLKIFSEDGILTVVLRSTDEKADPRPYVKYYPSVVVKQRPDRVKKILYWTNSQGSRHWFGTGSGPFKSCKYNNCISVVNIKEYDTSDAILFNFRHIFDKSMPRYRFPHHNWIIYDRESPVREPSFSKYNGLFNTTASYQGNSDIWLNYSKGVYVKREEIDQSLVNYNYAQGKTKLVAWFVSHCEVQSKRLQYVQHLQKYIDVDIYGHCGKLQCPKHSKECFPMLKRDYKFYLAFENSLCRDYYTEKVYNALETTTIPIVLGAFNYSRILPGKWYIDIKNFASPKKLAEYLKLLDASDTLYNEYFTWKAEYEFKPDELIPCKICEYLNVAGHLRKTYTRMDYFRDKDRDCYSPEEFYKTVDPSAWVVKKGSYSPPKWLNV